MYKLYAPDSSFRIYTWQVDISDFSYIQRGVIQIKTKDGSLKIFPLLDRSDNIKNIEDTVTSNLAWIGAVYSKILLHTFKNKNYYTLIGYDANSIKSKKKYVEVLHFENNQPVFGGPFFMMNNTDNKNPSRFIMEYKKETSATLSYDEEYEMILIEHLISENNEPQKKWTLVGDGDYDGLKWESGKWVFKEKIFNQSSPDGEPPVPVPLNKNF
ncbi:MAG: hypothetical protein FGM46_04165 [Ferruginibacter sp.]|nr:hypothetical protein [Ferruginibacter sp.]